MGRRAGAGMLASGESLSVPELVPARFMAVDAVCLELVSAMNSLVSGIFAGKQPSRMPRTGANNPEKSESFVKGGCSSQGI